ncbi:hypothetical protein ZWY2020_031261 [Hordeum vulgare]|nr:hypothetical protein ZWY2020_031261 [Hordeum vulgare]
MRRAVPGCLCRALLNRRPPLEPRLSSLACRVKSLDDEEEPSHSQPSVCSEGRRGCFLPVIARAVRTLSWDDATRKISFGECVRLYGLPRSIGLFVLLMQSFLPRRIREVRCLIQSVVDHCGNAGLELFELAPLLASNLGGSMTLLQVYATIIRVFVELSMFEDALLTYVEAKKVGVELQVCNFLLKRLVERNQTMYARSLFQDMKSSGPSPNVYSYSVLMSMYTHGAKLCPEEALELLSEMEVEGVRPNAATYATYLYGLCRAKQVHKAIEVFDGMKKCGFAPDVHSYSILVDGLCKQGDVLTDAYNYSSLIYAYCRHRKLKEALEVFELMLSDGICPNIVTCTILVHGFSNEGLIGEAFLFLDKVRQFGIVPNLCTYRVIINGLCKVNKPDDAWGIFADMIKRGYVPDTVLYSIIIDGFVKALDLHEAFRLYYKMLDEGTKPNIFTYTSLIKGLCHDDKLPEAMTLLKHMIGEGLTPDRILYTSLIACYCKRSNMKAALQVFREMETEGLSADSFVYTCLIGGFSKVPAMDGAQLFMEEMISKGLTPTVVTYTDLIIGYFKIGDEKKAMVMYNSMLEAGITPDAKLTCILGFDNDGHAFGNSQEEKDVS